MPTEFVADELKPFSATDEDYSRRVEDWLKDKSKAEISALIDHVKSLPAPTPKPTAEEEELARTREHNQKMREARVAETAQQKIANRADRKRREDAKAREDFLAAIRKFRTF